MPKKGIPESYPLSGIPFLRRDDLALADFWLCPLYHSQINICNRFLLFLKALSNSGIMRVVAFPPWQRGGGEDMGILTDYIVAVMASVVGHYICKWFDRHDKR